MERSTNGQSKFQSTPPARGATQIAEALAKGICISIHAPREGGDTNEGYQMHRVAISIHAPREGGDQSFNGWRSGWTISIHAPREGGDTSYS